MSIVCLVSLPVFENRATENYLPGQMSSGCLYQMSLAMVSVLMHNSVASHDHIFIVLATVDKLPSLLGRATTSSSYQVLGGSANAGSGVLLCTVCILLQGYTHKHMPELGPLF